MRNIENQTKDGGFASCQCVRCVNACRYRPGWFLPGEAEKAAELKGVPLADFFKQQSLLSVGHTSTPKPAQKYKHVIVLSSMNGALSSIKSSAENLKTVE